MSESTSKVKITTSADTAAVKAYTEELNRAAQAAAGLGKAGTGEEGTGAAGGGGGTGGTAAGHRAAARAAERESVGGESGGGRDPDRGPGAHRRAAREEEERARGGGGGTGGRDGEARRAARDMEEAARAARAYAREERAGEKHAAWREGRADRDAREAARAAEQEAKGPQRADEDRASRIGRFLQGGIGDIPGWLGGAAGNAIGGMFGAPKTGEMVGGTIASRASSFLSSAGSQITNLGLGSSIEGFLLNSGQKYLELSKVIATLGARFREAEGHVASFGASMGYTIAQTAGIAEAMGAQTNAVNRTDFLRQTGFARTMGIDPSATVGMLGGIQKIRGGSASGNGAVSNDEMLELTGRADIAGMSQGRMQEYLHRFAGLGEQQFQKTGAFDFRSTMAAANVGNIVYGPNDERANGPYADRMLGGLDQAINGGTPQKVAFLRAIGYGRPGGPSYIEAMKMMEKGASDPANIKSMFEMYRSRGLDKGSMFQALSSAAPSLGAAQTEALIDSFGFGNGLSQLDHIATGQGKQTFIDEALGKKSMKGAKDFETSGGAKVSAGEWRGVTMEGMQMSVGDTVSSIMQDQTSTMKNLAKMLQNIAGFDLEGAARKISTAVERLSDIAERASRPGQGTRILNAVTDDYTGDSPAARQAAMDARVQSAYDNDPYSGGGGHQ